LSFEDSYFGWEMGFLLFIQILAQLLAVGELRLKGHSWVKSHFGNEQTQFEFVFLSQGALLPLLQFLLLAHEDGGLAEQIKLLQSLFQDMLFVLCLDWAVLAKTISLSIDRRMSICVP
jgi:hypothetical protein